jgi:putative phage-type endonuclease
MMEQRSPEWFAARLGSVTASRVSDALAGPDTAARRNYLVQLVTERLTGQQQESFTNAAMQWGTDTEPLARVVYQATLEGDSFVSDAPFVKHPTIDWFGASPDGYVEDGLVEIKCPNSTTHIDYLMAGKVPTKYQKQMLAQLACTGREWCDFVSFDPRVPEHLQLFVVRFQPKKEEIQKLEEGVQKFLDEVNKAMEKLNASKV